MVIRLTSNVGIVLILTPHNSTSNVITFFDSSNKFNWELSSIYCQYLSNISASQIEEYFGFGGVLNGRPLLWNVLWVGSLIMWCILLRLPQMLVYYMLEQWRCINSLFYKAQWKISGLRSHLVANNWFLPSRRNHSTVATLSYIFPWLIFSKRTWVYTVLL